MIYILFFLILCFIAAAVCDLYIDIKTSDLPVRKYFLLGKGISKIIVIFFMSSMCYLLVAKPSFFNYSRPTITQGTATQQSDTYSEMMIDLLKKINQNTEKLITVLTANKKSGGYLWIIILFFISLTGFLLWVYIKRPHWTLLLSIAFTITLMTVVITFNLIKIENVVPKLSFFENIYFNFRLDDTEKPPGPSESKKSDPVLELKLIDTIEPFFTGQTYLEKRNLDEQVERALNKVNRMGVKIYHFILIGVVDKRPLKPSAKKVLASDKELAFARATKVEQSLRRFTKKKEYQQLKDAEINILSYGPNNIGPITDITQLAFDRRVDIYISYQTDSQISYHYQLVKAIFNMANFTFIINKLQDMVMKNNYLIYIVNKVIS